MLLFLLGIYLFTNVMAMLIFSQLMELHMPYMVNKQYTYGNKSILPYYSTYTDSSGLHGDISQGSYLSLMQDSMGID